MNIQVGTHEIIITQDENINAGEYNVTVCTFDFSDEYEDLTKQAVFSTCSDTYKTPILNNQCTIPSEVLESQGSVLLGVYGYESSNDELVLRYSPKPQYFVVSNGSYKEGNDPDLPKPSEWEQVLEQVNTAINETNNLNIEAEKVDHTTTITITHKDGEEQTVQILDGEKGEQGEPGVPGAVKFLIVAELPTDNIQTDAIYLVPRQDQSQTDMYDEYMYVNNNWELLGEKQIAVDLTDYVKFTDYSSTSKGGVIKLGYGLLKTNDGKPYANNYTYQNYQEQVGDNYFISKGTLENVITGKGLVSNTSYATSSVGGVLKTNENTAFTLHTNGYPVCSTITYSNYSQYLSNNAFISKGTLENVLTARIGDINSVLDSINGEVI